MVGPHVKNVRHFVGEAADTAGRVARGAPLHIPGNAFSDGKCRVAAGLADVERNGDVLMVMRPIRISVERFADLRRDGFHLLPQITTVSPLAKLLRSSPVVNDIHRRRGRDEEK